MTTFVLTVIGGVLIFAVGQILLKSVIEPAQELKKSLGTVSSTLLFHQAHLTNAAFNKEIALEIQSNSAEILSKSGIIIGYRFIRLIFGLPSISNIRIASRELNGLSYGMRKESKEFENSSYYNGKKTNFAVENTKAIKKIGELLNIQTTYK